ncbi:WD40-repeat-containing domain protein [Pisolithus marmoratus]|nr:WD40-repeat-containing domain protein [Pisolithus marmoratus]
MQVGNRVFSVAVSQDGRWIVSGENGNKVIIWNAATHDKVLQFTEHEHMVSAADISSDGIKIASADWFETRVFSSTSGIRRFATASCNSGFRVYSTHNGDILFDSGPDDSTSSSSWEAIPLAWPSDSQQLFVAAVGKIICFDVSDSSRSEWSIPETQSPIGSIISHALEIYSISLSPGGAYLACGLKGGKLTIHDLSVILPQYFYPRVGIHQLKKLPSLTSTTLFSGPAQRSDPSATAYFSASACEKEIASALSPKYYLLANRALIRAHLRHVALAVEDAKESLQVQPSPIGYIAMAVALPGQGDRKGTLCTFDLAFHDCEPHDNRLLLLLKSILAFECGDQEEAITRVEHLVMRANSDNDDEATYVYNQARALRHADTKENYGRAVPLIERAKNLMPKVKQCPVSKTILLVGLLPLLPLDLTPKKIFGWSFNGLDTFAQQRLCETHYIEERTVEAMDILLNIIRTSDEVQESKATADWITEAVTTSQVDDHTRALQMIVRLGQPFNALLFVQQPNGECNRVAAEKEIIVSGLGTDITPKNIQAKVPEIL